MKDLIEKLKTTHDLTDHELKTIIETDEFDKELFLQADILRRKIYGTDVYIRGLIEFTNYCRCNCYYCGIRCENKNASRYRLTKEEILECCSEGYELGFRTFVLQGGEDGHYDDDTMCHIVCSIKEKFPDCAVTLSIGERGYESFKKLRQAGADRYLLRHETADEEHYKKLHPNGTLKHRVECLYDLKKLGYQVGSGFMVGSPFQTTENLIKDIRFLQELKPDMIGIGPYIPHKDTPFANEAAGDLQLALRMVALLRLMFPKCLIPATTALGSIHPEGREMGLKAGANVVMPNLSPKSVREKYTLYNNKLITGGEAAEAIEKLKAQVEACGYQIVTHIGHSKTIE